MGRLWLCLSLFALMFLCQSDLESSGLGAKQSRIVYHSFKGDRYDLYAWKGKYVILLTPKNELDSVVIQSILAIADAGYVYLKHLTGKEPLVPPNLESYKTLIAVVDYSCGVGCGFLGHKGIEITQSKFQHIYKTMKEKGLFDTLLFYELGRNFWLYNEQLYTKDAPLGIQALRKGYAIFIRHLLVEELCISPGPMNGQSFSAYEQETYALFPRFQEASLSFHDFLGNDIRFRKLMLKNKLRNPGIASRFWASLLLYIYQHPDYGLAFMQKLLRAFEQAPVTKDADTVLLNFVTAFERADPQADSEWIRNLFLVEKP